MTDTKNVVVRAKVCVYCHVGWQDADVNHDLIAAGHPRLRFEFGAYLANYPARHWDDHDRKKDFEARAWLVGQVVSAKAALDLLHYRAGPKRSETWPEFAEYGCFSCHHDLRDQEWRQRRNPGRLSWGTWYFAERAIVAGSLSVAPIDDREPFDALTAAMTRKYPNPTLIRREAAKASRILDRWTTAIERESWDENALAKLLAVMTKDEDASVQRDWDHAAQRYLGIAAVYNALGDVNGKYRQDMELKRAVLRLAKPLGKAFPKPPPVKYDSPRDFEPDLLRTELQRLRHELERRGVR